MILEYDKRNGRPLVEGHEAVAELSDDELEAEVTIAIEEPRRRELRLDVLLAERARRFSGRLPASRPGRRSTKRTTHHARRPLQITRGPKCSAPTSGSPFSLDG